jgi:hypothetical protein
MRSIENPLILSSMKTLVTSPLTLPVTFVAKPLAHPDARFSHTNSGTGWAGPPQTTAGAAGKVITSKLPQALGNTLDAIKPPTFATPTTIKRPAALGPL